MGSWGPRTFEDDIACDWLEDLHDSDPIAFFIECLNLEGPGALEYLACIGVICTAEMLHALVREPREGLPEMAHEWRDQHQGLDVRFLVPAAIDGLRRVMEPESEMHVIWEDNQPHYEAWWSRISDLVRRLEAAVAGKTP